MEGFSDGQRKDHQVDAVFQFPRAAGDAEIPQVDEKRLLWKIEEMIVPLMFGVCVFQSIDQSLSDS
jgi:hypothetical protein